MSPAALVLLACASLSTLPAASAGLSAIEAAAKGNASIPVQVYLQYVVTRTEAGTLGGGRQEIEIDADPASGSPRRKVIVESSPKTEWIEKVWIDTGKDRRQLRMERSNTEGRLLDVFAFDGEVWRWWRPQGNELKVLRDGVFPGILPFDPLEHGIVDVNKSWLNRLQEGDAIHVDTSPDGSMTVSSNIVHKAPDTNQEVTHYFSGDFAVGSDLLPVHFRSSWGGDVDWESRLDYLRLEQSGMLVPRDVEYSFLGGDDDTQTESTRYLLANHEEGVRLDGGLFAVNDAPKGTLILDGSP